MAGTVFLLDCARLDAPQSSFFFLGRQKDHISHTPWQLDWNYVIGFWPKEYKKNEGTKSRCSYKIRCTIICAHSLSTCGPAKSRDSTGLRGGPGQGRSYGHKETRFLNHLREDHPVYSQRDLVTSGKKKKKDMYSVKLLPFGYSN